MRTDMLCCNDFALDNFSNDVRELTNWFYNTGTDDPPNDDLHCVPIDIAVYSIRTLSELPPLMRNCWATNNHFFFKGSIPSLIFMVVLVSCNGKNGLRGGLVVLFHIPGFLIWLWILSSNLSKH